MNLPKYTYLNSSVGRVVVSRSVGHKFEPRPKLETFFLLSKRDQLQVPRSTFQLKNTSFLIKKNTWTSQAKLARLSL